MSKNKDFGLRDFDPKPGPWMLDWSKFDFDSLFAWPESTSVEFTKLAGFLVRLNSLWINEVLSISRAGGRRAHHVLAVESFSDDAQARWGELINIHKLDSLPYGDVQPFSISYCLEKYDPRRIIVGLDVSFQGIGSGNRDEVKTGNPEEVLRHGWVMMPLWWDPEHKVTGLDFRLGSHERFYEGHQGDPHKDCLHDPD